jgi:acyl carrier protein
LLSATASFQYGRLKKMLDCAALTDRVAAIVRQVMPGQSLPASLASDADLYDAGLTSMAMVKLMLAVEVEFDIAIPDADLHPDNFRSIAAVEALVSRLRKP